LQELNHLIGVVSLSKVEVKTILGFLNVNGILVSTVLEDDLLEVEEGSLVRDLLTNLNSSAPGVVGIGLLTVGALLRGDDVFHLKCLLDDGTLEGFLLDRDLHLDTAGVRFGPDETGINNADFRETTQLAQTQSQQFLRFGGSDNPAGGGLEPSLAVLASVEGCFTLNTLGNIDGESNTV
jgi:hypothetical protein